MDIKLAIPVCKMCGCRLGQPINITGEKPFIICSSSYIEDWDYCKDCMIDHCCATNCCECKFNPGNYTDCQFLEMKKNYLDD